MNSIKFDMNSENSEGMKPDYYSIFPIKQI